MAQALKKFWMSWYQPTEDWRPLKVPLPDGCHFWCSGYRCSDDAATLCAMWVAESEDRAKAQIQEFWPEADEWRFVNEVESDWLPGDRFPIADTEVIEDGR